MIIINGKKIPIRYSLSRSGTVIGKMMKWWSVFIKESILWSNLWLSISSHGTENVLPPFKDDDPPIIHSCSHTRVYGVCVCVTLTWEIFLILSP